MIQPSKTERSYRVVRYHNDFGLGVIEDILGRHLSFNEAEKLAQENPAVVSDEEIAIEEEDEESPLGPTPRSQP